MNVLDELIEEGRKKGESADVVIGRLQVRFILEGLEEGERSPNEAKSRIDAVCSDLDDNDFLAEVEEKLRNSMKRFQISLQNMAFLERVIERARMNGIYEGKIRGRALGVIELLEEGDFSSERIKSKIYALHPFLDDKDFWAEIDEKLANS